MDDLPSEFLKNGEVDIHYVEAGPADGPLVVLLHGFPNFWYIWKHQIGPLADAGFHVVAPDMRGYNLSSKPEALEAYGEKGVLSDITALLDHFASAGCAKPTLVGHDWGGIVTFRFAQEHPDRLARIAVLNMALPQEWMRGLTTDAAQMQKSWYLYMFQQPKIGENVVSANDFAFLRYAMAIGFAKPVSNEDTQKFVDALSKPGALTAAINYYRNLFDNWGMFEDKKIELPVLYLWGDKEAYFEASMSEPSRELVPNIQVVHYPEATHWVMWDEPEKVNDELIKFLKD